MLLHRMRSTAVRQLAFLFLLVLPLFALVLPQPASAQSKTLRWHRWDADIQINSDGTFHVREVYEIEFIGGEFTFGFRNIPIDQFDTLTNFTVREDTTQYSESRSERPYTFYVSQDSEKYVVNWFYPSTYDQTRVFTVEYTVHGGLIIGEEVGDRFFWKAVAPDHDFPVETSTVIVHMPPGATIDTAIEPAYFGADSQVTVSPDLKSVTYQATYIPAGQEFEVGVRFPHGFVPATKPSWQADYEREQTWNDQARPMLNLGLGAVGVLVLLGGMGGIYLLWLLRGRDPAVAVVPSYLTEPPSDLPPALAGTLIDEKADLQDIVATVVDLARRGVIEMEEREQKFLGITTSKDFVFRQKPEQTESLRRYEEVLIREMFGTRDEIELSDLSQKFYSAIPKIERELYNETVQEHLFPVSPKSVRSRYTGLGIALGVITLAVGLCAGASLPFPVEAIVCPFISLLGVAVVLAGVGRVMPTKTRQGAEEAAKWRAFKNYLSNAERFADLKEVTDQFDRYLPYAIAFGLERTWINKFSRIPSTPIPGWYVPVGGRGYYGPSMTTGDQAGRQMGKARGGEGRDLRGEAVRPAPSLEGMSDRLSTGLNAMSGGLIAMLNSTASTFTSVPSSSGSGGFSGGGFSGGGFSGGGGGGGGGAGFG